MPPSANVATMLSVDITDSTVLIDPPSDAPETIFVFSGVLVAAGSCTLTFFGGDDMTGPMKMVAGQPFIIEENPSGRPRMICDPGGLLALNLSVPTQVSGFLKVYRSLILNPESVDDNRDYFPIPVNITGPDPDIIERAPRATTAVYLFSGFLVADGDTTITVKSNTTALTGAMTMKAGVPFSLPESFYGDAHITTNPGEDLCFQLSNAVNVGGLVYTNVQNPNP